MLWHLTAWGEAALPRASLIPRATKQLTCQHAFAHPPIQSPWRGFQPHPLCSLHTPSQYFHSLNHPGPCQQVATPSAHGNDSNSPTLNSLTCLPFPSYSFPSTTVKALGEALFFTPPVSWCFPLWPRVALCAPSSQEPQAIKLSVVLTSPHCHSVSSAS